MYKTEAMYRVIFMKIELIVDNVPTSKTISKCRPDSRGTLDKK